MIKIIEHQRGRSRRNQVLIRDNESYKEATYRFKNRGRLCDYFHTRRDEQGPIVTVQLYGEGDGFDLTDRNGRYREVNLQTVQTSDGYHGWLNDGFAIWLPDRNLWVGIVRDVLDFPDGVNIISPIKVDTNLASAIYEAVHGKPFVEEMEKLDPTKRKS